MKAQVKTNEAVNAEKKYVSAISLKKLHDCRKANVFSELGLKYEGFENTKFVKNAVITCITKENPVQELEKLFESDYDRTWFDSEPQFDAEKEKDFTRAKRVLDYIQEEDYKIVDTWVPYHTEFSRPLLYRGTSLTGIEGKFSFVLENKKGQKEYVMLRSGEPKYSTLARKEGNFPEDSIELLAGWLAVADTEATISLWHLKNKDDKGSTLPSFESRKGKNIVSVKFDDPAKVSDKFFRMLATQECADCDSCIHKKVCRQAELRLPESTVKVEEKKEQKEKKFTSAQQEVINHVNGPLCCIAVPGAGKTTALVERLVNLCRKNIRPESILMLTFTNKAAAEIEERVHNILVREGIKGTPQISTYNAFGFSVLKDNPMYLGRRVKLADKVDIYRLIKQALAQAPRIKNCSYAGLYTPFGLIHQMEKFIYEIEEKGEGEFREKYGERKDVDGILAVYAKYVAAYKKAGYISFDDQIRIAGELLNRWPALLEKYSSKYEYIMIDEFQDSSEEQVDMIYTIAHCHNNIVAVGDDDQNIYGWRGGSSKYMLQFQKDFPDAKMIFMEDNFRSRKGILEAANSLIQNNGERYEKKLIDHNDEPAKPVYVKTMEKEYLAVIVKKALSCGIKPGDIAILGRSAKRLEDVQNILKDVVKCALPKDYVVEDAVFIGIYDMLKLYFTGLDNDTSLYRVLTRMGIKTEALIFEDRKESLYNRMVNAKRIPKLKMTTQCMDSLTGNEPFTMVGRKILECFGAIKYKEDISEILSVVLENLFELSAHPVVDVLKEMADNRGIVKIKDLYVLMDAMLIFNTEERVGYDVATDAVNLFTCHDSKGKEFPTVIVYGVEDFKDEEEEIRVLYVSMTRAMKNLYLVETSYNQNQEVFERIRSKVKVVAQVVAQAS